MSPLFRDFSGGQKALDSGLKTVTCHTDGNSRLRLFMAAAHNIYSGDATKVGVVAERVQLYADAASAVRTSSAHESLMNWRA